MTEGGLTSLVEPPSVVLHVGPEGTVRAAAGACETLYGVPSTAMTGRSLAAFHPDVSEALADRVVPTVERAGVWTGDARAHRLDGDVGVAMTVTGGGDGGLVVVVRRESTADRARELEREHGRMERFAAIVSHDLRNPLTVASGHLELSRGECDSVHLDGAARALERIEQLIDDVDVIAHGTTRVTDPEVVSVEETVAGCWDAVGTAEATLAVESDLRIRADPRRLRHVFGNLLTNSVEHGSTGESATVVIRVGPLPEGFYVEDDGPGIPPSDREEVFELGYSTDDGGTGFGLHLVAGMAEAHGWTVRVTDADGGGARFEFTGVDIVADGAVDRR